MKNFLIQLLGGFTVETFDSLRLEANAQVEARESEVNFLRTELQKKNDEIQRLTNLMLTRAEFIREKPEPIPHHESINTRRSWPQIKREMERQDAERHADEVERRWKAKSGAVPEGDRSDESNG